MALTGFYDAANFCDLNIDEIDVLYFKNLDLIPISGNLQIFDQVICISPRSFDFKV